MGKTNKAISNIINLKDISIKRYFPVILLVILCLFFSVITKRFLMFQNLMIILQQLVVLLVAALGMTFIIMAGSIDLSVGSAVALTALVAAFFSRNIGALAIIPACIAGFVCGLINGVVFAKGKVPSFIVTMGTLVSYRGIVLFITKGAPVEIINNTFINVYSGRTMSTPHSVIITVVITIIVYIIFNNSVFSREVRAIGGGEKVAILTGIKVDRVKIKMYALAGLLYGLAGLLQSARVLAATASLGEGLELDVIASVVIGGTPLTGGIGSIKGTILGTLIITILSNGMNMMGLSPYIQYIAKGVVLVIAVFLNIDRSKIGIIK